MQKPTISSQPPANAPDRDEPSTFADRADAWVAWIRNAFYTFLESSLTYVEYGVAATEAAQQAVIDNTEFQGEWVSGTSYAEGDTVFSPTDAQVYRARQATSGTTDPSADTTNWVGISIANKQTSITDETADRLMINGAHGLGGGMIEYSGNIDDFTIPTGFYRVQSGATGTKPGSAAAFNMIVTRRTTGDDIGNSHQVALVESNLWLRSGGPTTWGKWYRGWTSESLLNSVSNDVDGDPSGGIIQRGANANGNFIRFADGTQICNRKFLSQGTNKTGTWTFPVSFASVDAVSVDEVGSSSTRSYFGVAGDVSTTAMDWAIYDDDGLAPSLNIDDVYVRAEGRWFT